MITFSLLSIMIVGLLATLTVLTVATVREPMQAAMVNPFGATSFDPSVDTLPMSNSAENTLAGDWQTVELDRLCDVETLLDSLEAGHARKTELVMASNNHFSVRWR